MNAVNTYWIQTLGCRVNHYEAEQLAALLRGHGLTEAGSADGADLRIVHSCSVTVQAASKSRQAVRRLAKLRVIGSEGTSFSGDEGCAVGGDCGAHHAHGETNPEGTRHALLAEGEAASTPGGDAGGRRARVVVTGCWATSDADEARALAGVDAVLGHNQDVAAELGRLLTQWEAADEDESRPTTGLGIGHATRGESDSREGNDGMMIGPIGPAPREPIPVYASKASSLNFVNGKLEADENWLLHKTSGNPARSGGSAGMVRLPMLGERQAAHQRAFLKVQDGCDAHCTYCIIPRLRPGLWSKPVDEAVDEARRLVDAGHREIVLTGIFLGAYGQPTALRRRQGENGGARELGRLVEALCTRVTGLGRLRLSSLEPGDVTAELVDVLRAHRQVVPHFHLPLQSGSDAILRKMNRQYTRGEFWDMAARLNEAFDRPAITTDIIVGFPGETDEEFERTVEVAERVGFVHTHAFSYSPRPGTAAARWTKRWVRGPVVNQRIERLVGIAARTSEQFRRGFFGEVVEVLVERSDSDVDWRHGRSERYFDVAFCAPAGVTTGSVVRVRVNSVEGERTVGTVAEVIG